MVDAQPALRLAVEALGAVVEPAEAVVHLGVAYPVAVGQPPGLDALEPLPLHRLEAGLALAQPALAVGLADPDIAILGGNVEVAHHRQAFVGAVVGRKQPPELGVELALVGKLHRVLDVLPLGEVAVPHRQGLAARGVQAHVDHPPLGRLVIVGEAVMHALRLAALGGVDYQRHAVVPLLAVKEDPVARASTASRGNSASCTLVSCSPITAGREPLTSASSWWRRARMPLMLNETSRITVPGSPGRCPARGGWRCPAPPAGGPACGQPGSCAAGASSGCSASTR